LQFDELRVIFSDILWKAESEFALAAPRYPSWQPYKFCSFRLVAVDSQGQCMHFPCQFSYRIRSQPIGRLCRESFNGFLDKGFLVDCGVGFAQDFEVVIGLALVNQLVVSG
jgi:hypothetical protein